ncbi:biotin-dependent carboxyltransferase family protein [Echinicola marina]|uniref:5-oxoprolinase subunit C family protein n=1 Tax=Echinicola marina TaxID=2859768 RepID=UPI001CF64C4E|nr:biotin-dependent carboxyltransferase family protein [Echinicola marina]UCS92929.1 biotin-dependent carboxyltransferase family protein [Echinicola marina]
MKSSESHLEVIKPGFYSTIQDLGRFGQGHWGIPAAGAMDRQSYELANHLLRNEENCASLEMTMLGGEFIFRGKTQIVLTGADAKIALNQKTQETNHVLHINAGDHLKIGPFTKGCRMYMAINGGFQTPLTLQSRSWYNGISEKHILEVGTILPYFEQTAHLPNLNAKVAKDHTLLENEFIEVYAGPESDRLPHEIFEQLFEREFQLSPLMNRMGIQLQEKLKNELNEILTAPVYPGTVQLSPGGKIMILMRDAQVTGGYPRILQLNPNAINIMAQKKQGDKIRFKLIQSDDL